MTNGAFGSVPESGNGYGKGKKLDLYSSYLRTEGYLPEVDPDGVVIFKMEGGTYLLLAHEDDREYFSVLFPNFWPIDSEQERTSVYIAACHATATTKVAKVYPNGDNVCASVELIFGDPEQFKPVFTRAMSMLRGSVVVFAEKMRELS